ncbi:MAG: hypothetical protein ABJA34_10055 [Pseudonocardiales bacterium]
MLKWRIAIGTAGVALGLFGVYRLFTQVPLDNLFALARWLIGAVILHDLILSPLVVGAGWAISRVVPSPGRGFVQAGLIIAGLITVIAIPMIYREDTHPRSKAILQQDYSRNLAILLGIIAGVALLAYAARVARDRSHRSVGLSTNDDASS